MADVLSKSVVVKASEAPPEGMPAPLMAALREIFAQGYPAAVVQSIISGTGWSLAVVPADELGNPVVGEAIPGTEKTGEGSMVALVIPAEAAEALAVENGLDAPDLHITLAYLGDSGQFDSVKRQAIRSVVQETVQGWPALVGEVTGTGRFTADDGGPDPVFAIPSIPGLAELRNAVVQALSWEGVYPTGKGAEAWTPHITLAYVDKDADAPPAVTGIPLWPHQVVVAFGADRHLVNLGGDAEPSVWAKMKALFQRGAEHGDDGPEVPLGIHIESPTMAKAADAERRFTLAPWYVPDFTDAHSEWTDKEELQAALWGYVRSGDRRIRLQHNTSVVAGEWVEAVSWPYEVTLPMQKADGTVEDRTYPAGTPFLGVIWEDWAWDAVKNGLITGYSIGGKADRLLVDLPTP